MTSAQFADRDNDDLRVARRIAAAVILQAQKDIHSRWPDGCGNGNNIPQIRDTARAWVRSDRKGWGEETGCTFRTCCELLELNERVTRQRVLHFAAITRISEITQDDDD